MSIEDFARCLAEFDQKYSIIDLKHITSGADTSTFLGVHGYQLQRIGQFSDAQADAIAEFEEDLREWIDLWDDLGPVQRRNAERNLDCQIENLRSLDLVVSMGQSPVDVTVQSNGAPMHVQVL